VLGEDMFWHPARWDHFERVFARYRNADLSQADPKVAAGIADIVKWRRRNRQAINRLLPQTHWPRELKHLEERLVRGEASVTAWARVLRENHRDHAGKPPPRHQHDGEVLIP
jgi:hypothetical protein